MRMHLALAALAASLGSPLASAQAAEIGTLTCTAVGSNSGSEAVALSCQFRGRDGNYAETYTGMLRRPGAQPINGPVVLMWTVSGDTETLSPGLLEQSYRGTATRDPENRKLQGQTNASIVLSPFAKTGDTAEQAVTVLNLDLKRTRA